MIKIKNNAFTLSEVLITLAVIGVLVVLVLPGLVKDMNSKAMMAMLQTVVADLNSITQTEITKTGTSDLDNTDIKQNPEKFFQKLDVVSSSSNADNFPSLSGYKTLGGASLSLNTGCYASAKLKTGVKLCMSKFTPAMSGTETKKASTVFIDLNGDNPPNIAGVDFYAVYIYPVTVVNDSTTQPKHLGDIGGVPTNTPEGQSCNKNNGNYTPIGCYSQAEQSGFDHNYWKELVK